MTSDPSPIVIVGGGMAADAACRGIRSVSESTPVVVLGQEPHPPYDRPPLSKALWTGGSEGDIWRDTAELGVEVRTGTEVVGIDRAGGAVLDRKGGRYPYGRLLLATGAAPRRLNGSDEGVVYLRTLDDVRALKARAHPGDRVAVLGGGLIGCEMAASLTAGGYSVDQFYPEAAPLATILPAPFADLLRRHLEGSGVVLHPGILVRAAGPGDGAHTLVTNAGDRRGGFAAVVAGLGVGPRDELARAAGIATAEGILVDGELRTSDPSVFAAGDAARVPLSLTGARHRIEHESHANDSGFHAGRAMMGEGGLYDPLPYLYSQIGEVLVEVVGIAGRLVEGASRVPDEPSGSGMALFRGAAGVTGALVWNRPGRARALGRLLRDPHATADDLVAAARIEG